MKIRWLDCYIARLLKKNNLTIKQLNNSAGITFIELLLVIAIIAGLGVMSASFYSRFLTQNSVSNVSDQIAGQLRKAQIYSMMGKQSSGVWGVRFTSGPKKVTLFLQGNSAFDESFSVNENINISGWSGNETTFARITGEPSNTPTITISGISNPKTLTINSMGVISR